MAPFHLPSLPFTQPCSHVDSSCFRRRRKEKTGAACRGGQGSCRLQSAGGQFSQLGAPHSTGGPDPFGCSSGGEGSRAGPRGSRPQTGQPWRTPLSAAAVGPGGHHGGQLGYFIGGAAVRRHHVGDAHHARISRTFYEGSATPRHHGQDRRANFMYEQHSRGLSRIRRHRVCPYWSSWYRRF